MQKYALALTMALTFALTAVACDKKEEKKEDKADKVDDKTTRRRTTRTRGRKRVAGSRAAASAAVPSRDLPALPGCDALGKFGLVVMTTVLGGQAHRRYAGWRAITAYLLICAEIPRGRALDGV